MAVATYTPTTSSDVNKIWRKVQTKLQQGLKFISEEWGMLDDLQEFDVNWSSREILVPLDINEGAGIASIGEGGYEARPSSPNVEELSLSWVLFNGRFTVTKTTHWIEQKSPQAMIEKQMKFQAAKKLQDMGRHYSDYHYGFTTAYLAVVNGDPGSGATSHTVTLKNCYNKSTITDFAFISNKFRVGDEVALVRSAALVTNAIGVITAVTAATPSIDVTWIGSVDPADGDLVVKANSLENATLTGGTDYNRGIVGVHDAMDSTSVHGLSSSSVANWSPVTVDTTGGRFSGVRLMKAKTQTYNKGGGDMDLVYLAQGVYRDMVAAQQAALRYSSSFGMEMDGSVKSKGLTFFQSPRVAPGHAICGVKSSHRKMTLLPKPGSGPAWEDGEKIPDRSAYVFSMDWPCALVWLNRGNWKSHSGLTEQ